MTNAKTRVTNASRTAKANTKQTSSINVAVLAANASAFIAGDYVKDSQATKLQTQKLDISFRQMKKLAKEVDRRYVLNNRSEYKLITQVALFGKDAVEIDGYVETICNFADGKKYKKNVSHGINFAPLINAVWAGLESGLDTNKTNRMSRAMNKILDEYNTSPEKYATDTVKKLVDFVIAKGGVSGLVSYKSKDSSSVNANMSDTAADMSLCQSVAKMSNQQIVQMHQEALAHYQNVTVLPTANFTSNVLLNEDGCSLVLVNQKKNGQFAVITQITDSKTINEAIADQYCSDFASSPLSLRVFNEVLATQCLPNSMQHTYKKLVEEEGKFSDGTPRKVLRRVVYKSAKGTFLMSAIRADSSVVTIAKPKSRVVEKVDYDLQLLTMSRRQLEKAIISPRQFKAYKLENLSNKAMFPCGGEFSHHLRLVPTVTTDKTDLKPINVYLGAESYMHESIHQVDISDTAKKKPLWERQASADWIKLFNSKFTNNWIKSHGQNITRPTQSVLELEFKSKVVQVNFFKKGSEYDTGLTVAIDVPAGKIYGTPCKVLSKDFATAMHGIGDLQLVSDATIRVFSGFMQIVYETDAAAYQVCIPFVTEKGERETEGFSKYQLVRSCINPEDDPSYQTEADIAKDFE